MTTCAYFGPMGIEDITSIPMSRCFARKPVRLILCLWGMSLVAVPALYCQEAQQTRGGSPARSERISGTGEVGNGVLERQSPDIVVSCPAGSAQLRDEEFHSQVFGEERLYRIFLPGNYGAVTTRYPVIYYFHGHSDRYTLEDYDQGKDTVPKICRFVAGHAVIVVAVDGYIAKDYTGFYGGDPYDIRRGGGRIDFGKYFLEQVRTIDRNYRTLTSRRYRAVSGLSMGGFMSLYLSARYPDLIGSSSAFNPGPEFYAGEPGRRSLWRPKDHVLSFEATPVRLVRASGDYISQYTEETRAAFAAKGTVDFEFRQDEYPRHWATSIGETFDFHMGAFAEPTLDTTPKRWSYASAFDTFDVWGYHVHANIAGAATIYLHHVDRGELQVETRRWAPDGPPASCSRLDVTTAALYQPHGNYEILDYSLKDNALVRREIAADQEGRLHFTTGCSGHEFGISGPGVEPPALVLLPVISADFLRPMPGRPVAIPVRLWNPGAMPRKDIRAELSSEYPTVEILHAKTELPELQGGQVADLSSLFRAQFTAGDGGFSRARLLLKVSTRTGEEGQAVESAQADIDVLVAPAVLPRPQKIEVLDGRAKAFSVFRQGVHGGGAGISRTVTEGAGNGNGILEPGERATVWLQTAQGLDPFDKGNWCRAKVYSGSPWLSEVENIEEDKQQEWTSAQNRTSVIELSHTIPAGTKVKAILDCETYSFYSTPDVRYGPGLVHQPFQLHRHQLYSWTWQVETTGK